MRVRPRRRAAAPAGAIENGGAREQWDAAPEPTGVDVLDALAARPPAPPAPGTGPVSDALFARLSSEQTGRLEARLEGSVRDLWDLTPESERGRLLVSVAAHYADDDALATMGLVRVEPPDGVHAMARGPLVGGGDLGMADFVTGLLAEAAVALPDGATVLDFGCSSGRVLRPIAAWRPDLDCVGCDPNDGAIAWATDALPMARWFVSSTTPPLALDDASVDAVYAISVWSHFSAAAGLEWLAEMHRVVKPGGVALVTTHGFDTLARWAREGAMPAADAAAATRSILAGDVAFRDIFGADGDWGVKDPGWGNSFMAAEWLVAQVTPQWSVRLLRHGALDANQDALVLERRP